MAFKHIQTEMKDGVAYLTLNRAPLNWLNIEMMEEIGDYLEGLTKEKALKLLVIQAWARLSPWARKWQTTWETWGPR